MLRHFFTWQFITFLCVGVTAASVNWLTRWLLSEWLGFSVSIVLAYAVGMTCAFILNRLFVFVTVNRPIASQVRDFVLVNAIAFPVVYLSAMLINQGLLFMGFARYSEDLAHAIALGLPMMISFLIYKFYTFKTY